MKGAFTKLYIEHQRVKRIDRKAGYHENIYNIFRDTAVLSF